MLNCQNEWKIHIFLNKMEGKGSCKCILIILTVLLKMQAVGAANISRADLLDRLFNGYDENESPTDHSGEPTKVFVGIYVLDLFDISDTDMVRNTSC